MRSIRVLYPDGREDVLPTRPTLADLQRYVGGYVEAVRVLEIAEGPRYGYTWMYVNEEGLNQGLPRNEKATALYQRNIRTQYPGHPDPFGQARRDAQARHTAHTFVVSLTPDLPGYAQDPWIAGTAVYFQGWTCAEVDAAYNAPEED